MKPKEAIKRIKEFGLYHAIKDLPNSRFTVEAFEMAIAALEKQITKEPILQGMAPDGYWEVECQECGARTSGLKNYPNYCGRCGQAFKWSE